MSQRKNDKKEDVYKPKSVNNKTEKRDENLQRILNLKKVDLFEVKDSYSFEDLLCEIDKRDSNTLSPTSSVNNQNNESSQQPSIALSQPQNYNQSNQQTTSTLYNPYSSLQPDNNNQCTNNSQIDLTYQKGENIYQHSQNSNPPLDFPPLLNVQTIDSNTNKSIQQTNSTLHNPYSSLLEKQNINQYTKNSQTNSLNRYLSLTESAKKREENPDTLLQPNNNNQCTKNSQTNSLNRFLSLTESTKKRGENPFTQPPPQNDSYELTNSLQNNLHRTDSTQNSTQFYSVPTLN